MDAVIRFTSGYAENIVGMTDGDADLLVNSLGREAQFSYREGDSVRVFNMQAVESVQIVGVPPDTDDHLPSDSEP